LQVKYQNYLTFINHTYSYMLIFFYRIKERRKIQYLNKLKIKHV